MLISLASSISLEDINQNPIYPDYLKKVLKSTTTFQKRVETTLITSLRAKNNFAEWIAALLVLDPIAKINNEKAILLAEIFQQDTTFLTRISSIDFSLYPEDLLYYEKVANTPADRPIISICVHLRFSNAIIQFARIAATGLSNSAFEIIHSSDFLMGKILDADIIQSFKDKVFTEINPSPTYLGSATYKKEMAGLLIERILSKSLNGDIS